MKRYAIDPKKVKALLFDWDETLVETEFYQYRAYVQAFKKYGIKYPSFKDHCIVYSGNPTKVIFSKVVKNSNKQILLEKFALERRKIYYAEIKKGVKSKQGALKLISEAKKTIIKLGIVTGNASDMLHRVLNLSDLPDVFDIKITVENYKKNKPDPEPFLIAAKKLRVKPSECVVFGDAINDIKAARSAKMDYFVIQSITPAELFYKLDKNAKIIRDFTQVKLV